MQVKKTEERKANLLLAVLIPDVQISAFGAIEWSKMQQDVRRDNIKGCRELYPRLVQKTDERIFNQDVRDLGTCSNESDNAQWGIVETRLHGGDIQMSVSDLIIFVQKAQHKLKQETKLVGRGLVMVVMGGKDGSAAKILGCTVRIIFFGLEKQFFSKILLKTSNESSKEFRGTNAKRTISTERCGVLL